MVHLFYVKKMFDAEVCLLSSKFDTEVITVLEKLSNKSLQVGIQNIQRFQLNLSLCIHNPSFQYYVSNQCNKKLSQKRRAHRCALSPTYGEQARQAR